MIVLSNLKSFQKKKKRKIVGRGNASGHGTYSTRGMKGQRARTGSKRIRKGLFLLRSLPKIGGFKSLRKKPVVLNLNKLDKLFQENERVSLKTLERKGIIKKGQKVKILANGELKKKLIIKDLKLSKKAKEKLFK